MTGLSADYGWVGQHQKATETDLQNIIQMGARPYHPGLGRFLAVDPVEGGTPNDYVYVTDPINSFDLNGMWGIPNPIKAVKRAAKAVGDTAASVGRATVSAGTWVGKTTWEHRDTIGAAMGVAALLGCVICAGIATGISLISTVKTCTQGIISASCAVGLVGLIAPEGLKYAGKYYKAASQATNLKVTAHRAGQGYKATRRVLRVRSARLRNASIQANQLSVLVDVAGAGRDEFARFR